VRIDNKTDKTEIQDTETVQNIMTIPY